ncbi:MAG: SGNH/GDSL hydrolase family protein [Planctomycetes bacterium]|nr:SGNH/GDSL hydrolase family protein [Planctomycetota bacterium]
MATLGGCMEFRLPDPDVRVIAFGDSTTTGPSSKDYHEFLRERLGEDASAFAAEGSGGEGTRGGVNRLRGIIALNTYPNADTLLIWHGGNDIIGFIKDTDAFLLLSPDSADYPFTAKLEELLDEVQANLELEIALARGAGWDVFLATLFPIREQTSSCKPLPFNILLAPQATNANRYLNRLNDRIRLAAENAGAVLVDIEASGDELTADANNYFDCNHLSEAGNEIAADIFFNAINLLQRSSPSEAS